ncbi:Flp family type IVb pilin [Evansella sp. LMS18]|nr:Flp family type IVb pilin [Evansella sp. LMS18]UTR12942.1 Flp family type IVb pilin [Evansella sp. LMS18]
MKNKLMGLVREEEGQGMAEYAIVLGVIAVGVVALLSQFGTTLQGMFERITGQFSE